MSDQNERAIEFLEAGLRAATSASERQPFVTLSAYVLNAISVLREEPHGGRVSMKVFFGDEEIGHILDAPWAKSTFDQLIPICEKKWPGAHLKQATFMSRCKVDGKWEVGYVVTLFDGRSFDIRLELQ